MKITKVVTTLLLLPAIAAYNPFKGAPRAALAIEGKFTNEFDPTALLESRPRNSEIYTKAMIELKRLESEQTCHRLAAQLLMNNCRDVKEMSDEDSQLSNTQNRHVESFANGLTLCDLSRGKFVVSDACSPFTASALLRVYQNGKGKLEVSSQQTAACIEALAKDHSQWLTWLKHRDNALMFCRAVRLDIDKDQTINLHKELTRLMAEFAEGLVLDLDHAQNTMAEHAREMASYFENSMSMAGLVKAKMQSTMEYFTNAGQDMSQSMQKAKELSNDVQRTLKVLAKTAIESNAELAAGQEQALAATTDLANSRMMGINSMADDTLSTMDELKSIIMDKLVPAVISISERQEDIEQKSENLNAALNYMTYMIGNHSEAIEEASLAAEEIASKLGKVSAIANSWNCMISIGGIILDVALFLILPTFVLLLGSYGLKPSMARNVGLIFVGLTIAGSIVYMHRCSWDLAWMLAFTKWAFKSASARFSAQLAREMFGSPTTTVEFELA